MKLTIEKSIYGGAGLARSEGKAIFVPFTLPGETVEAQVTRDRGGYAEAELIDVIGPSPKRVPAPCKYFGECGGCHYQHASYEQQLEIKKQILRETLERAHLSNIPDIVSLSAEPMGYRNRARFHLDRNTSKLSYKKRGTHANLAVDSCPISAPLIEEALSVFNSHSDRWQLAKSFDEVELFTNAEQNELFLSLWSGSNTGAAQTALQKLWAVIEKELPRAIGAAVFSTERENKRSSFLASAGNQSISYAAADQIYRVSIGSFFQVNRFLIDPLVELVTKDAEGKLAWDLYAGVGLFARVLQSTFDQVVAVEAAPSSVQDLRHNLADGAHRIVASSTLDFLRRAASARKEIPDFVVIDPPRAGLGKEVTALLEEIQPAHITYVSCDPATLSRDLKSLLDSGYSLQQLHMVDMFPQTFHLESVAKLSLK
ncbi:23S rRNA (uracil1939-C5)-methyltransferase [Silvibacterium bohemicum]|uniref:23S rRNA (Uracil1939-C5)-methyltransferase n=1 Tax=Silvibacterium bohemicum TaxID=1577686 RepID=A0A841K561_9BACT|nr:23S rRNA (uracil(1939)-C(5))-methyltransferase RlmD [Silvibacterium bohemicum]MBB6147079.1 23S rRNA (uracil1939-C5)-methyltransferase [Silvibacterium bohemicum]